MERNQYFDVIFLDIQMSQLSGINVGKFLRNKMKNEITQIIFISSNESYAIQLFKVRPLDFLIKPIQMKDIEEVMDNVVTLIENGKQFFEYNNGKVFYKIPLRDIYYFKSEGKKVLIKVRGEEHFKEFYGKLEKIVEQMSDENFLLIHKSFLVHYDYISEYRYDCVTMVNGEVLAISQANRNEVRSRLMNYRRERM
jgi:DNA-binding LytR/AlgR family response regulator